MKPNGGGEPSGHAAEVIKKEFGGFDTFKTKFNDIGLQYFGSGWVWLVLTAGKRNPQQAEPGQPILPGHDPHHV